MSVAPETGVDPSRRPGNCDLRADVREGRLRDRSLGRKRSAMKLLIVGGTAFVGRAIAWSAWHHGHEVTVLQSRRDTERLARVRLNASSAIARAISPRSRPTAFDATIDVTAYRPSDVERLANALESRGGHYMQISSISAYGEPQRTRFDRSNARTDERSRGSQRAHRRRRTVRSRPRASARDGRTSVTAQRWCARPTSWAPSTRRCAFPTGWSACVAAVMIAVPGPT